MVIKQKVCLNFTYSLFFSALEKAISIIIKKRLLKKHLDTKTRDLVQCCTDEDTFASVTELDRCSEGAAVHKVKETSHKEQTLGLFDVEVEKTSHKKVKKKKAKRKKDKDDMGAKLGVELAKIPIECDKTEHTTYILTDVRKNDKGGVW